MKIFTHNGYCPICEKNVTFESISDKFRDNLKCPDCNSIPRERALYKVINDFLPNYKELTIHESSPINRGASKKLSLCKGYTFSHYFTDVPPGSKHPVQKVRCENLEKLTFSDQQFDLFITQDVMEHIFNTESAFKEIARVIKPGGMHIFTVPLVRNVKPSIIRSSINNNGCIIYHRPPVYHGNPVDAGGSLVTVDWGYDIVSYIYKYSGMVTAIILIDNLDLGIRANLIEVLVSLNI